MIVHLLKFLAISNANASSDLIGLTREFLHWARKNVAPDDMMSFLATVESRIMNPIRAAFLRSLGLLGLILYMLQLPGLTRVYERHCLDVGNFLKFRSIPLLLECSFIDRLEW